MKLDHAGNKVATIVVFAVLLGSMAAMAQVSKPDAVATAKAAGAILKIRDLTGCGPRALVKSPDSGSSRRASSREWVELAMQYDTEPEWIDELTFNYYVLLRAPNGKDFTLLKGVVNYLDVARGRGHLGVAYVRPAARSKFGEIVAVAVEAVVKGELVGSTSEGRLGPGKGVLPPEWWKNPNLSPKDGYVLDKSKTPFALVNFDDYEALK